MPGPWAWTLIVIAAYAAVFIAVIRGLIDSVDGIAERRSECGRVATLPLRRHQCWHCRHPARWISRPPRTVVH